MILLRENIVQGMGESILKVKPGTAGGWCDDYIDLSGTEVTWLGGELEGSSKYLAGTFGIAGKVNDFLSLSIGIRYIDAKKEFIKSKYHLFIHTFG